MISVIVPVHDHFAITCACLRALHSSANRATFEVLVVDDSSSDDTTTLPKLVGGIGFFRNETAQGFVHACNFGASRAHGKYLVFLNNDTLPTPHWLDELLFVFETFEDVGLAGSKLIYPDGRLQEAGGIVWNTGNPWNYGRNGDPEEPKYNYTRQVDYVSGASIMLPRDIWDSVEGFSDVFIPAYFEDTDLAFKVRVLGKQVVYAPRSVIYHHEGVSSGVGTDKDVKQFQEINRETFKRRWVYAYQTNGAEGVDVDLVKDRGIQARALVIDKEVPLPNTYAGGYAALQEIRLLQSLGVKVTFLPLERVPEGEPLHMLQRLGVECVHAPHVASIDAFLTERSHEFDLVYITRYTSARRVLKKVRRHAQRAKILLNIADLHFLRTLREGLLRHERPILKEALRIRDEELGIMRKVDVVLTYSAIEQAIIQSHNFDRTRVVTAPWVVDVKDDVPPFTDRRDIAFLGAFDHLPNLIAVQFFATEVMPLLRVRLPGVRFRIYGSNVTEELNALACEDVRVDGFVEDVTEVYETCRVFVAPILAGAGLKGKVIEALAFGTPSVLSPIAAEGTGVRNDLEALIAEGPEEWMTAVAALYEDPRLWEQMSSQGREYARATYSFARGQEIMAKAIEAAGILNVYPRISPVPLVSRTARPTFGGLQRHNNGT